MFTLPALPYPETALAPHVSAQTISFHYGKHHQGYVDKLNKLTDGTSMASLSLEAVIQKSYGNASSASIFNNAAQCWNHEFLWNSMSPNGGGAPSGEMKARLERDHGGYDAFAKAFTKAATDHFGSGWAWLTVVNGALKIETTHDADLPLAHGNAALFTCDLWEHAYYLDRQNRRPEYIAAFLGHLVNWDFANANLAASSNR